MKLSGLSVGKEHDTSTETIEAFATNPLAESPLGKLLIALVAEKAWSGEYGVYASFGDEPHLNISHPAFLPGRPLMIYETSDLVSVRDVENALRAHFQKSWESIEPAINILGSQMSRLHETADKILTDKAKAAIVTVFPEAVNAYRNRALDADDFRGFVLNGERDRREQIFFAREADGEFTRGIARVNMTALTWHCDRANSELDKHRRFWEALAITFAAKELGLPEDSLYCQKVDAEKKEWLWPRPAEYDPYIVREVELRPRFTDDRVVVSFGADSLPAEVVQHKKEAKTQV